MTAEPSPVHSEITSLPTTAGISLDGNPYNISTTGLERRVHELINQQRTISGFVPLFLDPVLSDIARDHSEDMAAWNYFAHVDPGGENPTDRGLMLVTPAGRITHRTTRMVLRKISSRTISILLLRITATAGRNMTGVPRKKLRRLPSAAG
jgi:hypothetical protein